MHIRRIGDWRGNELDQMDRTSSYYYGLEAREPVTEQDISDLNGIDGVTALPDSIDGFFVVIKLSEKWGRPSYEELREKLNTQLVSVLPDKIEFRREPGGFTGDLERGNVKFDDRAIFTVSYPTAIPRLWVRKLREDPRIEQAYYGVRQCIVRVEGRSGVTAHQLKKAIRSIITGEPEPPDEEDE